MTHTMYEEPATSALPALNGPRVTLRPLVSGEALELAPTIAADAESAPWWGSDPERVRAWLEDRDATSYAIVVDGHEAGVIQYYEETDPDYHYASMDIALLSPYVGKGYGTEALRVLARHLFDECGHHRLHIDPAVENQRAIDAYKKVGFKPVGVLRRYERAPDGRLRDALLMDMIAEELTDHPDAPTP